MSAILKRSHDLTCIGRAYFCPNVAEAGIFDYVLFKLSTILLLYLSLFTGCCVTVSTTPVACLVISAALDTTSYHGNLLQPTVPMSVNVSRVLDALVYPAYDRIMSGISEPCRRSCSLVEQNENQNKFMPKYAL